MVAAIARTASRFRRRIVVGDAEPVYARMLTIRPIDQNAATLPIA
jgi:hypothetical protein